VLVLLIEGHTPREGDRRRVVLELDELHDLGAEVEERQAHVGEVGLGSVRELGVCVRTMAYFFNIYNEQERFSFTGAAAAASGAGRAQLIHRTSMSVRISSAESSTASKPRLWHI